MRGRFVISLDFELHWGMFDKKSVDDYRENLDNTREVLTRLLDLSNKYGVRLTFATVGFLFAKNREELKRFAPTLRPSYVDKSLNPYLLLDVIGDNETQDPYHYGRNIIENLRTENRHEIGTHTFSHYYCRAKHQSEAEFKADLIAAKNIAEPLQITLESIVFPRNQTQASYLGVCAENGIKSYRGNERSFAYRSQTYIPEALRKGLRFLDSYVNIFGHCTYDMVRLREHCSTCLDLPSSRFLRPYSNKFKKLEPYKIRRIKKAMTYAAKKGNLFHLWWHPHNFGSNMKENFSNLESIYDHFQSLEHKYGFKSETMTSLANKLLKFLIFAHITVQ